MTLPNLITIARLIMVPIVIFALIDGQMTMAFSLFLLAGLSDGVDGFIARHFNQRSELGGYLDPIADKFLLVSVFVVLGYMGNLPLWLVILVVSRDLMIVTGVMLADMMDNRLEMKPIMISKINTTAQIMLVTVLLADLAGYVTLGGITNWAVGFVALLTTVSAAAYLYAWLHHMTDNGEG